MIEDTEVPRRRLMDNEVAVISHTIGRMANDMDDMKTSMKELTVAMNRLALAEERISHMGGAVERAFKNIELLIGRVNELERKSLVHSKTSDWVDKVIWLVVGAVVTALLIKLGLQS